MNSDILAEWQLVAGPTTEPITDAFAKLHAGITGTDDDTLITAYVKASRQAAENYLNRGLFTQTWKIQLSEFAEIVWLPMASPLASISSVTYYDTAGALQTLASTYYIADTVSEPGRMLRAPDQAWPSTQSDRSMPITITYVVGQSTAAAIPEIVKQGILMHVAYLDAHRMGDPNSDAARRAAEHCWDLAGRTHWLPPQRCL